MFSLHHVKYQILYFLSQFKPVLVFYKKALRNVSLLHFCTFHFRRNVIFLSLRDSVAFSTLRYVTLRYVTLHYNYITLHYITLWTIYVFSLICNSLSYHLFLEIYFFSEKIYCLTIKRLLDRLAHKWPSCYFVHIFKCILIYIVYNGIMYLTLKKNIKYMYFKLFLLYLQFCIICNNVLTVLYNVIYRFRIFSVSSTLVMVQIVLVQKLSVTLYL